MIVGSDQSHSLQVTGSLSVSGSATIFGDLTVKDDLTVDGTTTTVNSTIITIDDPILTLGGDAAPSSDDNKDRGVEFRWHNGSAAKVGFFGFDDSTGKFTFIPDATNSSEVFSGSLGAIDVGDISSGHILPSTHNTYDLGASDNHWRNIYTGDLHLRNERGNWTIVEEEDFLCVVNNKTGKKYEMVLKPIDD
jgi:hypothetical protein